MGRWKKEVHLPSLAGYKEIIIVMMRHGGAVDRIARDLGYPEKKVVDYIKAEGIDMLLNRRSWTWKETRKGRRRIRGQYKPRNNKKV